MTPDTTFQPLFTDKEKAQREIENKSFDLVRGKVQLMLETVLSDQSGMPQEWAQAIKENRPLIDAVMQLAQAPDVQWNPTNLLTTINNKQIEASKPVITITEADVVDGPRPVTSPVNNWKPLT